MVALILIFCLTHAGTSCKAVHPDLRGCASVSGCMQQAQFVAADELNTRADLHGYRLARWRCQIGVPEQRAL